MIKALFFSLILTSVAFGDPYCDVYATVCGDGYCTQSTTFDVNGYSYQYSDFNAISFSDFNFPNGDTEGRLVTKQDFTATQNGVSIGFVLPPVATSGKQYSAIIGGNAAWSQGNLYPSDSSMFVGGTFTGPADLSSRVSASCGGTAGCLDSQFNTMKSSFQTLSNSLNDQFDSAMAQLLYGNILQVTCTSQNDIYFISVDVTTLSATTSYAVSGCNANAAYVFNVDGTGTLVLQGQAFFTNLTIYNVRQASTVFSNNTVMGSILALSSSFAQTVGSVDGQLIVQNVLSANQVNMPTCGNPMPPPPASTTNDMTTSIMTTGLQATTGASQRKCHGKGTGDPWFTGYDGKSFEFSGYVGGVFNIFNDPWLNVNAYFDAARSYRSNRGTIMTVLGIVFDGHKLSIKVEDSSSTEWAVEFDGVRRVLSDKLSLVNISECIYIQWEPFNIVFRTPRHRMEIGRHEPKTRSGYAHIDYPYLDFSIAQTMTDAAVVGGVLGQTAIQGKPSRSSHDFVSAGLFASDSKRNHFEDRDLVCKSSSNGENKRALANTRLVAPDDCANYQTQLDNCKNRKAGDVCGTSEGVCIGDKDHLLVCTTGGPGNTCTNNYDCPSMQICSDKQGVCYQLGQ